MTAPMPGPGQLDKQSAVVAVAYRYLGLDAHALKQAVQKALRGGLDALGVLGLIFGRSGLGGALRVRLGALGAHLGLGRGFFDRRSLVGDLVLHADDRGGGAYAEEAALGALDYLDGDVVTLQTQLCESSGQSLVLGLPGFFKVFNHFTFSCCSPFSSAGASSMGSSTSSGATSSAASGSMASTPSLASAAASVASSASSGFS